MEIQTLSKAKSKFIKSLHFKKSRLEEGQFIIEGRKNIFEVLNSDYEVSMLVLTEEFLSEVINNMARSTAAVYTTTERTLIEIGTFKTNDTGLAIVRTKPNRLIQSDQNICLDDIRDPGNLGTIIRIADWFGIRQIICSQESADCYNPKVINSTMGSFFRVNLFYTALKDYIKSSKAVNVGAFMSGQNLNQFEFPKKTNLIIGNESNGIHPVIEALVDHKISIAKRGTAESLNAAVATGIICHQWKSSS